MKKAYTRICALCIGTILFGCAYSPNGADSAVAITKKSSSPAIDFSHFDYTVRPQDDLFRHVNGGWIARVEIPKDKPRYGTFEMLHDQVSKDVLEIITQAGSLPKAVGSEEQKIADLYASFMDEDKVEKLGTTPIRELLARVSAIESREDLAKTLGELARCCGTGAFKVLVGTDDKKSDEYIVYLWQGGLGLPDRDYYLDSKFRKKLTVYGAHVRHMLTLSGISGAKTKAEEIVFLETLLAEAHWRKEDNRDPEKIYNKHSRDELKMMAPSFDWDLHLDIIGISAEQNLMISQPSYFTAFSDMVRDVPLSTWKAWLLWSVINTHADFLNKDIVGADFAFYGKVLKGTPENQLRLKRGVKLVEDVLGEAVGKVYVKKLFPPEAKERMNRMIENLIEAYRNGISALSWMSPETKKKALAKLDAISFKIGYPNTWRNYEKLEIRRDDLVGNVHRFNVFELERNLSKLGKPVDRDEWFMAPQTVNAYYNPGMNEIVFPAGILRPPFFNFSADDAVNYGAIGSIIGHEVGHAFDDQGSKYDGVGNLENWWTENDRIEFERRTEKLAAQYDEFEPVPGFRVNGSFTVGENVGDLTGVTTAYAAYNLSLNGEEPPLVDGYTDDERFFFGFARWSMSQYRDEALKHLITTNEHSPPEYRVNGVVRNVPVFYETFGVKEGDKLFLSPEERVKIW